MIRRALWWVLVVSAILCCSVAQGQERVRLATTTSTDNSGLLAQLLPPFEERFGVKVDVIAVGNGKELQTNVQRVGDPTPPKGVDVGETLPATLTHSVVARVIRRRVSRLRYCLLGGAVKGRSGKAVITLSIGRSGEVSSVKVSAPAFRGTNLSSCVKGSAKLWRFPKFRKGTITHSYPVIFRGR